MIKVGIIGGAGYTAGELLRILVNHPEVEIVFVHSTSNAGNHLYDVHGGLFGDTELRFSDSYDLDAVDVLFLCSAHGKSREFWEQNACPQDLKVIDLAQDYRDESDGYVYGLPEWQRDKIRAARKIANPGCFATAIQLALLPLSHVGLLQSTVHVTAITGSTGAGVKPSETTHFSWRTDNLSTYKVFEHQHLKEICRNLNLLACHPEPAEGSLDYARDDMFPARDDRFPHCHPEPAEGSLDCARDDRSPARDDRSNHCHPELAEGSLDYARDDRFPARDDRFPHCHPELAEGSLDYARDDRFPARDDRFSARDDTMVKIQFVPMRGDFARGIFASVTVDCPLGGDAALKLYRDYYADAAFTFVADRPVDLKQVVNTNKCILALEKHDDTLVISSVIDNLLKGASGQAVQNMNLLFGLPETTGLRLKASAF